MLAMRQILLGSRGAKLPYDAEVEYLESTGSEYIDTGVPFDSRALIYDCLMSISNGYVSVDWKDEFFGAMNSDGNGGTAMRCRKAGATPYGDLGFMDHPRATNLGTVYDNGVLHMHLEDGLVWIKKDGAIIATRSGSGSNSRIPCGKNVWLFCGNNNNRAFRKATGMRLYGFTVTKNDETIQELIPVRVGSGASAVGYMYDRVSNMLLGNDGTGAFAIGPNKS